MSRNIFSYEDSKAYIVQENANFSYSFYYNNFCQGMSRTQVALKFQADLDNSIFDINTSHIDITKWIKTYNCPILKSNEVEEFWILQKERKQYYNTLTRQNDYRNGIHNAHVASRSSVTKTFHNIVEGDSLVFFNNRSISSILKSYGKELFTKYEYLTNQDSILCGYTLNGILDLTNQREDGQKKIFTKDQWSYLNKHFNAKNQKYMEHLHQNAEAKLLEIIKEIKTGNTDEAYYLSLEYVRHAHEKDKCIFKILNHVINAYKERAYIFTNPLDKFSELDFMLKIWSEILELLFGDENNLYINWGETVPHTTTEVKKQNNEDKAHTIGCKVDGRVVCKLSKIVDTCHIEAAKASVDYHKIYSDKFKLAAESKCTIDDIIMSGKVKDQKYVAMYSMQIYGLQAEMCCLKLVDRGFYVNTLGFDLSLANTLEGFSKNMIVWVRRLLEFKKTCVKVSSISTQAFNNPQPNFSDAFQRDDSDNLKTIYCNPNWVTGTPILPKQIVTSTTVKTLNRSLNKRYVETVLEDGTMVISKFNKKKKRQSQNMAESSKKKSQKNK